MGGFGRDPIPGVGAKPAPLVARTRMSDPMRLRVCNGPAAGREFPLDRLRMRIGRSDPPAITVDIDLSECELSSPALVSRLHAELVWIDGELHCTDLGSRNGTWVDELPLTPAGEHKVAVAVPIKTGTKVRFANLELEVVGTEIAELTK